MSVNKRVGSAFAALLLALLCLASWALSSPPGATPDEDFHLTSIWCSVDDFAEGCAPDSADSQMVLAPAVFTNGVLCYAHDAASSGACLYDYVDDVASTSRFNISSYPSTYYRLARLLVSTDIDASVIRIRLANGLLGALLVAVSLALYGSRSWLLAVFILVLSVPVGTYFVSSLNPTGYAVTSIIGFGLSTIVLVRPGITRSHVAWALLVMALSLFAAVGTRRDTVVICALLGVLGVVRGLWIRWDRRNSDVGHGSWRRFIRPQILFLAGATVALSILFLRSSVLTVVINGFGGDGYLPEDFTSVLVSNIVRLPEFYVGFFAGFNWSLGWFDTPMPMAVFFGALLALILLLIPVVRSMSMWSKSVVIGLNALIIGVVLVTHQADRLLIGGVVQPRYFYPLFVISILLAISQASAQIPRSTMALAALSATLAHSVALWSTIRRHVTGTDVISWDLNRGVEWWWESGPSPVTVWLVGSIAFGCALSICARQALRHMT